jgi:monofunctional biosynthetic peptidoglycan transglycosylase
VLRRLAAWARRVAVAFLVVTVAGVLVYRVVDPPLTPLMLLRLVEAAAAGRPLGIAKRWVDLEEVSPALLRAVLAAEDARFLTHRGIDLEAVRCAAAHNARHHGRHLRGAGTITMQCARNVFLWPGRSWVRKALEVTSPVSSSSPGKRRILEVYLNVIEWGAGTYGVEAAAERYFGVPAVRLDGRQAALLAAALPDPRRSNPAAPSAYLATRAALIAARAARVAGEPLGVGLHERRAGVADVLDLEGADDDAVLTERGLDRRGDIGVAPAEAPAGELGAVAAREEAAAAEGDGPAAGEPKVEGHAR